MTEYARARLEIQALRDVSTTIENVPSAAAMNRGSLERSEATHLIGIGASDGKIATGHERAIVNRVSWRHRYRWLRLSKCRHPAWY
jgi:hypothetical protein